MALTTFAQAALAKVLLGSTTAVQHGERPDRLQQQHQASLTAVQPSALQ